ncbi:phospholipase D-like domain-containing protein [uncultured Desulfuromonas sp.]|uniref:phospholipase D-like domain-containing protein n=1 Tax=uncultured Desulfuromonas sp. TaxID=181013 RepID=UPI00260BEF6A|nr:phospholipase D-like domain-containing protein [uncultured Desulfuromonas sp.]
MLDLLLWIVLTLIGLLSAGHALLHKRDPRAALGWIVLCLLFPGAGPAFYWLLGVNRIRTRARNWQRRRYWSESDQGARRAEMARMPPFGAENFASLVSLADAVTRRYLLPGNRVTPLHNGEEAYPAMLEAIAAAECSICLSTYIFDTDATGRRFADALRAAAERGLDVRVLVDALGERYSLPTIGRLLRGGPVRLARFLPPSLTRRGVHLNLRNHRKLLVIDDKLGFTGGMNLGDRHLAERDAPRRVVDIHFRLEGPIVGQMREAFLEDWHFATGEPLPEVSWPEPVEGGAAFCRGISAGPNEDFQKLSWLVLGALNCARRRICIMTPYFIPDGALIAALNAAALRGVKVDIILPRKNNLPYVKWATSAYLWEVLQHGTRIYYQPPPFVHSKMLLVDGCYALLGSANLDPRSLRLNFEFNVEVYDPELASGLEGHFKAVRAGSHRVTLADVDGRSLPVKLRDAAAKLFSPYL